MDEGTDLGEASFNISMSFNIYNWQAYKSKVILDGITFDLKH